VKKTPMESHNLASLVDVYFSHGIGRNPTDLQRPAAARPVRQQPECRWSAFAAGAG